jgi:DNA modification methylase
VKIEEVRIDEISNHERNPKQHPDKQIRLLEESIKRFGWTNPVILDKDGRILAGHARVKAAIEMGQDSIPCIRTKLSGKDADAYLLADNRLSDIAPYDRDILAELLSDLPKDLVDLTGFDSVQVDALLAGEDIPDIEKFISDSQPEEGREEVDAEPQIDRAAELNKKWQVQPGDLWQLGDHRLICGDCTDPAVVERVTMGEKADLVLTDPPYGIDWNGDYTRFSKNGIIESSTQYKPIQGDNTPFDPKFLLHYPLVILWGANFYADKLPIGSWLVWDKRSADGTSFLADAELAWHNVNAGVYIYSVNQQSEKSKLRNIPHPTKKPVELFSWCINRSGEKLSLVFDPFLGSGTTLIACENTGRKCRGIEISPDYCAVILQRFKDATGKEPVRING